MSARNTCSRIHTTFCATLYSHLQIGWHSILRLFLKLSICTRRTRILMEFLIDYLVLIVNPMGRILVRRKSFRNHLEMLCRPICNCLYLETHLRVSRTCSTTPTTLQHHTYASHGHVAQHPRHSAIQQHTCASERQRAHPF